VSIHVSCCACLSTCILVRGLQALPAKGFHCRGVTSTPFGIRRQGCPPAEVRQTTPLRSFPASRVLTCKSTIDGAPSFDTPARLRTGKRSRSISDWPPKRPWRSTGIPTRPPQQSSLKLSRKQVLPLCSTTLVKRQEHSTLPLAVDRYPDSTPSAKLFKAVAEAGAVPFPSANWLRRMDSNHRPQGYEPCELPDCSTPPKLCYSAVTSTSL
jgi:hypothetical protein